MWLSLSYDNDFASQNHPQFPEERKAFANESYGIRMIVVKGMGKVRIKPDLIVLTMNLHTVDLQYERAMDCAAGQIDKLHAAIQLVGMDKNRMKTTDFSVMPQYDNRRREEDGEYVRVFTGYAVCHQLKLEFPLDTKLLGEVLGAVSGCGCEPSLQIAFTVADREAVSGLLLEEAARDARQKAEILARASGVSLGALVSVDYRQAAGDMLSESVYRDEALSPAMLKTTRILEIQPDDLCLSDWATFSWEIV